MNSKILTNREYEIFSLLIENYTTSEIAKSLEISEKTVRNHISNVIQKLGVTGRAAAVIELLKLNVVLETANKSFLFIIELEVLFL